MYVIALYNNDTNFLTAYSGNPAGQLYPIFVRRMDNSTPDLDACEQMWSMLNVDDRPGGRVFRSMSVGDVVAIVEETGGLPNFYAVSSVGFAPVDASDVNLDADGIALLGMGHEVVRALLDATTNSEAN